MQERSVSYNLMEHAVVQAISLNGNVKRMAKSHLCSKGWKTGFHFTPSFWNVAGSVHLGEQTVQRLLG